MSSTESSRSSGPSSTERVRQMYDAFPYPPREPAAERRSLHVTRLESLDAIDYYAFGGQQTFDGGFRALVVGGGSGDQCIFLAEQLRGREAEIVYLDLSQTSLEVARSRAEVRGLRNISWHCGSLLDLPRMGLVPFNFISAYGVLHHLPDPPAGLAALREVLAPDGAIGMMVYGRYGRTAVYQMQELLRLVSGPERSLDGRINDAKAVLEVLPPTNWFRQHETPGDDHRALGETGICDMLLHPQDRAYSIPELYEYIAGAGLAVLGFPTDRRNDTKSRYRPDPLRAATGVTAAVAADEIRSRAIAELLHGDIATHACYVARGPVERPTLADPMAVPYFSLFSVDGASCALACRQQDPDAKLWARSPVHHVALALSEDQCDALALIDGRRTLAEIRARSAPGAIDAVYEIFHEVDWLMLKRSPRVVRTWGAGEIWARGSGPTPYRIV